jgi:hypothetical protein
MQMYKKLTIMMALILFVGSLSLLSGCGGGGSSATTPAGTNGMISGTAVKGPVAGATVTAYGITNDVMGTQVATGTTDLMGNFNISIGDYTGPVMLQMSGE